MGLKSHLADVFRFEKESDRRWFEVIASSFFIVVPIIIGILAGHEGIGVAIGVGALLASNITIYPSQREQIEEIFSISLSLTLSGAVVAGLSVKGIWADIFLLVFTTLASVLGNFDRYSAILSGRFIVYVVILTEMARHTMNVTAMIGFVLFGGVFSACFLGAGSKFISIKNSISLHNMKKTKKIPFLLKYSRWVDTFKRVASCQFSIRIFFLMLLTLSVDALYPHQHFLWATLTVVLLCKRQLEIVPIRASQRAMGTVLGVIFSSCFVFLKFKEAVSITIFIFLVFLSMICRNRNYFIYSVFSTPLMMILIGGGYSIENKILIDRLVSTIFGSVLVIISNYAMCKVISYSKNA